MELKLIGLTGDSRCGKDSTAKILQEDFGFQQRAMADGIREILLGLDPLVSLDNGEILGLKVLHYECEGDWDLIKARSAEATELMIRLGQSARTTFKETVWLDRVLPDAPCDDAKICISDVRQVNEYEAIKARGGQVWKISRPGTKKRGMDGLLDHLEFDAHIDNRGTLADLRGIVAATISADITRREYKKNYGVRF